MLFLFATTTSVILISAAVIQLIVARYFLRQFAGKQVVRLPADSQSGVAVLMCVRGCDPSLRLALISVLRQEFAHYEVHVVVDHRSDAAWEVVHEVKREFDDQNRLSIHELKAPRDSCGLKCSSLLQGLEQISDATRFLVLLDSDVETHPTWIAELIGPLEHDPTIGLVTGNQWFEPPGGSTWGALVRSSWNAGALVPTVIFGNPWAGTFAMRMRDVRAAELPLIWQKSVVDDGPLRSVMQKLGLKIHFAPSLIMINHENCTFGYVNRWVTRMLTWSRIYEPTFFLSVVHAVFSNVAMFAVLAALIAGLIGGDFRSASIAGGGLLISGLLSVFAYVVVRSAVSQSCGLRNEQLPPMGAIRFIKLLLTVPIAQLIYGVSCLRCLVSQRVQWREITYELTGNSSVKMLDYRPFVQTKEQVRSNVSI